MSAKWQPFCPGREELRQFHMEMLKTSLFDTSLKQDYLCRCHWDCVWLAALNFFAETYLYFLSFLNTWMAQVVKNFPWGSTSQSCTVNTVKLPIYHGLFSPHNSWKTPIARPFGRGMVVFSEFLVWLEFYFRIYGAVCSIVPYCTAIYQESIIPWFVSPGHNQPQYWPIYPRIFQFQHQEGFNKPLKLWSTIVL